METNVWTQLFALVADIVSLLSKPSNNPPSQSSGGASPNVLEIPAASTSTSKSATSPVLRVIRDAKKTTTDALFGDMTYNNKWLCFTMERTAVAIPEGTYNAHLEMSPHFGFVTPHIDVPQRTYIEIHPANYVSQLEGCVAVGSAIDGDAVDNSRRAFDSMMSVLPQEFTVEVCSSSN
jgi:hypothetical protein